jgi:hypothetical protein
VAAPAFTASLAVASMNLRMTAPSVWLYNDTTQPAEIFQKALVHQKVSTPPLF